MPKRHDYEFNVKKGILEDEICPTKQTYQKMYKKGYTAGMRYMKKKIFEYLVNYFDNIGNIKDMKQRTNNKKQITIEDIQQLSGEIYSYIINTRMY